VIIFNPQLLFCALLKITLVRQNSTYAYLSFRRVNGEGQIKDETSTCRENPGTWQAIMRSPHLHFRPFKFWLSGQVGPESNR
jgi:hypothetical protein